MHFGPAPPARLPEQDIDILIRQLERFQFASESQRIWSRGAVECIDFSEGKQWKEIDRLEMEKEGRPALVFNKISPIVRLVLGYERANRHDIKYQPGSDALSNQEIADVLSQNAKQVHQSNMAPWKYSEMFRDGILCGRGYLDFRLDFGDNILGDIAITSMDPFSVYPDAEADSYDPKDWNEVFVTKWMSLNDIELLYGPKASTELENITGHGTSNIISSLGMDADLDDDLTPERFFGLWKFMGEVTDDSSLRIGPLNRNISLAEHIDRMRKTIRVIDRQWIKLAKVRSFVDLKTGATKEIPDIWKRDRIQRVIEWAGEQGEPIGIMERVEKKVRWTVTAADVILHDDWSPYRSFTVIPYFGYFRRGKTRGLVNDLLDPQREINKRRSAQIHIVGSTASAGWMYESDAMSVESKALLLSHGTTPGVNIELHPAGLSKIERITPQVPPTAMQRLELKADEDMKTISGVNESALGQDDKVISGKAIEARQRQAIIGIETYLDNMDRTRHLAGEKILELTQDHLTEERFIRTLGDDGKPQDMTLNQRTPEGAILNDVRIGKYTTSIDSVPATASFQQAQFEEAMEMVEKGIPVPPDVLVDLSSMPQKEEIKKRIQEQLAAQGLAPQPNGAAAPNGQPQGPQPNPASIASEPIPASVAGAGFGGNGSIR